MASDAFVKEILKQWKLEQLINVFEENEIDEEAFRSLNKDSIKSLIPKIGPQVKFMKNWCEMFEKPSVDELMNAQALSNEVIILDNHPPAHNTTLHTSVTLDEVNLLAEVVPEVQPEESSSVPEDDPVWKFYLLLRQILALLTSTSIQTECMVLLEVLIQEHHSTYIELFSKKLKPKAHHMIHYPKILVACGPLVHLWCMRFEANHKPSKSSATVSSSKRNVVTTVALKQQLKLANALASNTIFANNLELGPGTDVTFAELLLEFENNTSMTHKLFFVKWVKKNGILYKPGMVVCVGEDDGIPEFAIIKHIFIRNAEISFVCKEIETLFINHVNAFEVYSTYFYHKIFDFKNLLHHLPSHITKMNGSEFVVVRSLL